MVTAMQFDDWRRDHVTQALLKDLQEAVFMASEQIVSRRDSNPDDDQFLKGFIKGIATIGEWMPEIVEVPDEA